MNKKRYTAKLLSQSNRFILNVPTVGMEELVLQVGSCSGQLVDKWATVALTPCLVGCKGDVDMDGDWAIKQCVAHIVCVVNKIDSDSNGGHNLLHCTMLEAFVSSNYWNGKIFCPLTDTTPPLLSFLGSQQFVSMNHVHE